MSARLPVLATVILLIVVAGVACSRGNGSGQSGAVGSAEEKSGTESSSDATDEQEVMAAVSEIYRLVSDGQFSDLWEAYSSDFRRRCSFNAMVRTMEALQRQGVFRLLVGEFDAINVTGQSATARYTVNGLDRGGSRTTSYEYELSFVKEGGRWLAEESCF